MLAAEPELGQECSRLGGVEPGRVGGHTERVEQRVAAAELRARLVDPAGHDLRGIRYVAGARRVEADYLRPARFDDTLEVVTTLTSATGSRIQLDQAVTRDGETLFQSTVTLVCVDIRVMRAHRMPPASAAIPSISRCDCST